MEMLETERLELVPLRAELLRMWTEDIPGLEKRLGCSYKAEPMEGMFLHIVEEQLKIVQQIAGILGETAADTKVAVEKLKNTILLESEEENEKK